MASSAWRTSFLSPRHGEDVFFVIHSIDVPPSINGVGLIKEQSGVSLRRISRHTAIPTGHNTNVVGLLPGSLKAEYPIGEIPR